MNSLVTALVCYIRTQTLAQSSPRHCCPPHSLLPPIQFRAARFFTCPSPRSLTAHLSHHHALRLSPTASLSPFRFLLAQTPLLHWPRLSADLPGPSLPSVSLLGAVRLLPPASRASSGASMRGLLRFPVYSRVPGKRLPPVRWLGGSHKQDLRM